MANVITLELDCGVRLQIETDASNFDPFNVTAHDRQAFGLLQTLQNGRLRRDEPSPMEPLPSEGFIVKTYEYVPVSDPNPEEPPREPAKWNCPKCGPRTDNQVKDRRCHDCGTWGVPYDAAMEGKQPENPTRGRSKATTRPKWKTFNCSKCGKSFRELKWRVEGSSGRLPSTCDDCVTPETLRNRRKARDAQIKKGNPDPNPLVAAPASTAPSASGTR